CEGGDQGAGGGEGRLSRKGAESRRSAEVGSSPASDRECRQRIDYLPSLAWRNKAALVVRVGYGSGEGFGKGVFEPVPCERRAATRPGITRRSGRAAVGPSAGRGSPSTVPVPWWAEPGPPPPCGGSCRASRGT